MVERQEGGAAPGTRTQSVDTPRTTLRPETLGHLPGWLHTCLGPDSGLPLSSNFSLLKWECLASACSTNESQEEMVCFLV